MSILTDSTVATFVNYPLSDHDRAELIARMSWVVREIAGPVDLQTVTVEGAEADPNRAYQVYVATMRESHRTTYWVTITREFNGQKRSITPYCSEVRERAEYIAVEYDAILNDKELTDKRKWELMRACPPQSEIERDGAQLIQDERIRHRAVKGWTAEHNSQYDNNELAEAARCYMDVQGFAVEGNLGAAQGVIQDILNDADAYWPFDGSYFKPHSLEGVDGQIRDLVKAGALIAAQIDVLLASKKDPSCKE